MREEACRSPGPARVEGLPRDEGEKALDDLPSEVRTRLEFRISELLESAYPSGCKKPKGAQNAYRLRVGDYRILYQILNREEILVFKIAPRSSAYE